MRKNVYTVELKADRVSLWKDKRPLLVNLDMELTERCNNNCIHCYINLPADDLSAKDRELTTEELKEVLTEAASLGCLMVRFTGGEPLLREDFEELYFFARSLGLKVLLFTNATLVTPKIAQLFAHMPPLEKIEVTVYGMEKKSYEAVTRTPGSFEASWRGIKLILEHKIPFVVKTSLLPDNKGEMDEFEEWAATIPWMDSPVPYGMFFDLHCRRNEDKNGLIRSVRVPPEEGLKVLTSGKYRKHLYLKEMRQFCSKFIGPPGTNLFSCGSGVGGGCVDAYGYFQPCMVLRHPETIYNLKNGSLKDALVNFFPRIREMKATNLDYLRRCGRCFLKGLCDQCPGQSWLEHGTLDTPVEYRCEIAHVQAKCLGLLGRDEKAWEILDWSERIRNFTGKELLQKERSEASRLEGGARCGEVRQKHLYKSTIAGT